MKKIFLPFIYLFFIGVNVVNAQELYMPRNIKNAYDNGTRSMDGNPGKNYWQNKGVYDINVTLNPEVKTVSGSEKITYTNNSPDTLGVLAIRFVNNMRKISEKDYKGLDIESLSINNEKYTINTKNWGTVSAVRLKSPMMPNSTVEINIDWNYPISIGFGREGQIDSTSFFLAYSYPRVSVYDDSNGWDMLPHTGRQEFYNDFNDYTLSVKAPKDYVVWATGDLLNPDEVLQPEMSNRLKKSYTSDEVIQIADLDEMQQNKVTTQKDWNTWKFSTKHITDVCFAASKNYVWDAASVVVDSKTNRRASVQSAYNTKSADFHHYTKWAQNSLGFFSHEWPGVAYPFSKMTSFQGFADMEYPMMINDNTTSNLKFSQLVQDHEIAHTYFPFYMGTNETRYAFMDEGWATTFEYLIGQQEFGKLHADSFFKMFRVSSYISDPSTEQDQPLISLSTQVSGSGYGSNAYGKAALSYLALKDLLGDQLFKKALHHYMDTWNGKHPLPWDYFNSFNAGAGQDLNWFFNNWYFSNNYLDLKIKDVKKQSGFYHVAVENVGGFAIPFDVKVMYEDGTSESLHQTPGIWKTNQKEQILKISTKKNIRSVELDGGIFMDYTPMDNIWKK